MIRICARIAHSLTPVGLALGSETATVTARQPDAGAPSPISGWAELELPEGYHSQITYARETLMKRWELAAVDLVEALQRFGGEHLGAPQTTLRVISVWAWCWTAGTECPMNPTSEDGHAWAQGMWVDFNVGLGRLAARVGGNVLEARARGLVDALHRGARGPAATLRLDLLFALLGGTRKDMRIEIPHRAEEERTRVERWHPADEAIYEELLRAAKMGHRRPTYLDLEQACTLGPNTVSAALSRLKSRGMFGEDDAGGWWVLSRTGTRLPQ